MTRTVYETLLTDVDDGVFTITLNRPEALNTIVPPMPEEFEPAMAKASRDDAVRVVVVRGKGGRSRAGYDFGEGFHHWDEALTSHERWDPAKDASWGTNRFTSPHQQFFSMWRSPKPVIAQVRGWCVGGGSDNALLADIVIASEDAVIGTPYSRMWGAYLTGMWIYRLGLAEAKWRALTGEPFTGREAADIGLINEAVPFGRLEDTVAAVAARLKTIPSVAADGAEDGRQSRLRANGGGRGADPGPDHGRCHAQHTGRAGVDREGRHRRGAAGHRGSGRPVRGLQLGPRRIAARTPST